MCPTTEVAPGATPASIEVQDVFASPWGGNVEVIRNIELEKWLAEHHLEGDIFVEKDANGKGWTFSFGPFTITVSVEDLGGGKYKYTATLYFKKLGVKFKIWTFTFEIDTNKGSGSYCHEVNVVGIVKGKICILYENKTFYLYFRLEAFGKVWEKKYKLFSI
ncbi:hypothetical protein CYLTODRAFT_295921 [Cylindrobasidium torrendii FP15055 ss-10]|uniref:Uncharacterized protein n=1 Tax=Cylindrobasidium torrendii FP15055 ss-10 TaxID=1314674 RepID=A0A0D7BAR0_9AGAR|nr:hypothetical protein CYLTODRAFT_295921 [Cylindrobasidium torrendii FP15055 ss-10]